MRVMQKTLSSFLRQTNHQMERKSNSVIGKILGKDKFVRLNLVMLKKLGPNAACFLTYLLDKAEFFEKSGQIYAVEEDGMYVYRNNIQEVVGLSHYSQRQIEKELKVLGILNVVEEKTDANISRNRYYIDVFVLDAFLEKEEV